MNSRERVQAVFERRLPDRCPIDFRCTEQMQAKLIAQLRLPDAESLYRMMGHDFRFVQPRLKARNVGEYYGHFFVREPAPGRYVDNWGITWQRAEMESGDVFYDVVEAPLREVRSVREVEQYPFPDPADEWDFSGVRAQAERYPEYAVAGRTSAVFDDAWRMLGFERMLLEMALNPELAHAVLRKVCDYWMKFAELLLQAARGRIDVMWSFDDLGTQNGLVMSAGMCREFIIPLVKERADLFRRHGAHVAMHSCGSIAPIVGDLMQAGVECLNPIQPAAGMDRAQLKARHGNLVFHGSVDQQRVLVPGKPADVIRDTRECIDVLGRDGGYIVAASHEIEADIPVENVTAMFLAAQEYGVYRQ